MAHNDHNTCYGTMFPSVFPVEADRPISGKVFTFELTKAGRMFIADRQVSTDIAEWDNCLACPEFDPCYKLSLGKVMLEAAIH